jgi:hypothetical protein
MAGPDHVCALPRADGRNRSRPRGLGFHMRVRPRISGVRVSARGLRVRVSARDRSPRVATVGTGTGTGTDVDEGAPSRRDSRGDFARLNPDQDPVRCLVRVTGLNRAGCHVRRADGTAPPGILGRAHPVEHQPARVQHGEAFAANGRDQRLIVAGVDQLGTGRDGLSGPCNRGNRREYGGTFA